MRIIRRNLGNMNDLLYNSRMWLGYSVRKRAMNYRVCMLTLLFLFSSGVCNAFPTETPANPVLPGADPHVLLVDGTVWLYPTHYVSPLTCFYAYSSTDMQEWEEHGPVLDFEHVYWLDEDGAKDHRAWAPCVTAKNGRYFFYYSVGPQDPTPSRIG
ncbi:MAG TPA: hypothetical protein ENN29_12800, partial [Candidatus Hydrogenedentes bacterium]|nr:hypothetical protein [Candidatus Hydrogenedentota bacterium]